MMKAMESTNDILIIDDDEVLRELLPMLLAGYADSIFTAESGHAALDMVAGMKPERRPSIILADLQMPGLLATQLAESLRVVCPPHARLIAMSGAAPSDEVARAFDAFLAKPFNAEDFAACLHNLQIYSSTRSSSDGRSAQPVDAAIFSKLLMVMGEQQLDQLYRLFVEDAVVRVTRMVAAASEPDATALVREAHALKGSCGMLGATELHNLAGRLEAGGLECTLLLNDFNPAIDRLRRMLDEQTAGTIGVRQEVVQS